MPRKKIQAMLINWSLARCSCPSWSANTDESALRIALASLDDCNSSLHWWLGFFTVWVVVGVALELVFVVWEYIEELHDFRRGIVHPPDRPNRLLFALGFFAAGLVALGVGGELYAEAKIATLETCIRKGDDALFLLLSKEAAEAKRLASVNELEAAQLRKDAEAEHLARVKIEASVAWRHLSANQKSALGSHLDFDAKLWKFGLRSVGIWYEGWDTEASMFAADIAEGLQEAKTLRIKPPSSMMTMRESTRWGQPVKREETGVSIRTTGDKPSRRLADSIIKELNNMGFDALIGDPIDSSAQQVEIWILPRPEGPQGIYKLQAEQDAKAETRKHAK